MKMLNKYNQNHKERLQNKAREIYQNVSEEERDKKQKQGSRKISESYRGRKRKKVSVLSGT